jgi:hypothetical protein
MAGYAVECSIKAYLQRSGIRFPTSGRDGHALRTLWAKAGFRVKDLGDRDGAKSFYLTTWTTDLRYTAEFNESLIPGDLVKGARELTGWLQTRVKRVKRRR